jgi:enediyne biosynthesis protein E4
MARHRPTKTTICRLAALGLLQLAILTSTGGPAVADDGGVTFTDVAASGGAGISYRRARSSTAAIFDALKRQPAYTFNDLVATPINSQGSPGVAILDYDGDDDLDLYVTNGPGACNSLYANQLAERGQLTFMDMAAAAGVCATDQDTTGVCFGDIDNDGDEDLLTLGRMEPNRLFDNRGDGTFADISATAGIGGGNLGHTSCSMGDVDGDGLLDIVVGNTFDWADMRPIFVDPFARIDPNQLYRNLGGNRFADISAESGVLKLAGMPPGTPPDAGTITWGVAMVDYDQDGDLDIIHADDQAAIAQAKYGGLDRGFIHIFRNDGTGHFTDVTVNVKLNTYGSWMGLAFGDFNCDGRMDLFSTNEGDWMRSLDPLPHAGGDFTTRWFLQHADGTFEDPGAGDLQALPFGFGTSAADYDNDGDTDLIFHGGIDVGAYVEASNPGAILRNPDCSAHFERDAAALAHSTNHARRTVAGMAMGDLNGDGFLDIVTASGSNTPESLPLMPFPVQFGGPFEATASFVPTFRPDAQAEFIWNGIDLEEGTLSIEVNSGSNANGSATVRARGSVGTLPEGRVNRDGIGAVVRFLPEGGKPVMRPVLGGASYSSQDGLEGVFGLGAADSGTVEVLWPGGVWNRLYDVRRGERVLLPEVPCSYAATWSSPETYRACVDAALEGLTRAGVIGHAESARLLSSALRAFSEP